MAIPYHALDPGIRKVVRYCECAGLRPTDSGDGRSKAELIAEGYALDYPHVHCVSSDPLGDAQRLMESLTRDGVSVGRVGGDLPWIQSSFDPSDGTGTVTLGNLDDNAIQHIVPRPETA